MSGSGQKSLPEVWEALSDVWEFWGGPPRFPDVREDLPVVREWSIGSPGRPEVIVRYSQMSGSGQKALPNVQE